MEILSAECPIAPIPSHLSFTDFPKFILTAADRV